MARTPLPPPKQRTRAHVIADQSVNYVERFIINEGHTAQRSVHDYGYDLAVATFDENGYAEPGLILIQIKAAESLTLIGRDFAFDLDVRDYDLWMRERMPVLLVLFDASRRRAYWVHVQHQFGGPRPRPTAGGQDRASQSAVEPDCDPPGGSPDASSQAAAVRALRWRTPMPEVTYGQLDTVLRSLGLSVRFLDDPRTRVYVHEQFGPIVTLPDLPPNQPAHQAHLLGVQMLLDNFGIADPKWLAAELQKAS